MNIRVFFQLFLICIALIFSIIFFKKYFIKEKIVEKKELVSPQSDLNLIKDIKYFSTDNKGNTYEIIASSGITNNENPYLIELKNVQAKIIFEDNRKILISSNHAIYNQENYDTEFSKNVRISLENHDIKCNTLSATFSENTAILKGDVIYKNLKTKLFADVMEIDLITKSTKTFMINKNDKVKINYLSK